MLLALAMALIPLPANAQLANQTNSAHAQKKTSSGKEYLADICKRIEIAAGMWTLPPGFLARLIWKESRFNPNAVSPVGASGIAQFMPATARLRNLEDPFDPKTAIPASAHYLSDLRNQFGNLGLAAASYNAGPGRVSRWLSGTATLPFETWDFVNAITGYPPQAWREESRPKADFSLHQSLSFRQACLNLPIQSFKPKTRYAKAPWQPWGGHLTADWSPSKALSHYAKLQAKFPEVLAGQEPMVIRVINPSFGRAPRYEIRIGKPDRAQTQKFCNRLKKAGGVCLVTKTERQ